MHILRLQVRAQKIGPLPNRQQWILPPGFCFLASSRPSSCCFVCFYLSNFYLKSRFTESETDFYHLLVHSPDSHNGRAHPKLGASPKSFKWAQGLNHLPLLYAGRLIRSGEARTRTSAHMGCSHSHLAYSHSFYRPLRNELQDGIFHSFSIK